MTKSTIKNIFLSLIVIALCVGVFLFGRMIYRMRVAVIKTANEMQAIEKFLTTYFSTQVQEYITNNTPAPEPQK